MPGSEYVAACSRAAAAIERAGPAIDAQFERLDTNRDGKLKKDELPRMMRQFFERLDKDSDGALTKDEAKGLVELLGGGGTGGGRRR